MARVPRIELSIVGLEATLRPAPTHIWSVAKEFAPSQPLEASALQAFGLTRVQSTVIGFALIQQVPPAWLHALDRRCSIQGTRSLMKPKLQIRQVGLGLLPLSLTIAAALYPRLQLTLH